MKNLNPNRLIEYLSKGCYCDTLYRVISTHIEHGQWVDIIESSDYRGTTRFTARAGYLDDVKACHDSMKEIKAEINKNNCKSEK